MEVILLKSATNQYLSHRRKETFLKRKNHSGRNHLTLSEPHYFQYLKEGGSILLKIGKWNTLYSHMQPLKIIDKTLLGL